MSENIIENNKNMQLFPKSLSKQDELIAFCRLLSTASKSGKPLTYSLDYLNKNQSESQIVKWADDLSTKLKQGHSLEESVNEIKKLDPVLARLMPLLGDERLVKVFEIYTRFLIKQDICFKQISCLVWYPLLVMVLSFAVIIYLNFNYFPCVADLTNISGFFDTWSLKLLYFANPSFWPFSFIVPLLLLYLIVDCSIFMISGHFFSLSLWAKISGLEKAADTNNKSRLAALLSIYMEAGYSLTEAIEASIDSFNDKEKEELENFKKVFSAGNNLSESLIKSKLMSEIINGKETNEELITKFNYAYDSYSYDTIVIIKSVSEKLFYIPLIIAGLMVLAVSSGLFGTYSLFVGNIL